MPLAPFSSLCYLGSLSGSVQGSDYRADDARKALARGEVGTFSATVKEYPFQVHSCRGEFREFICHRNPSGKLDD